MRRLQVVIQADTNQQFAEALERAAGKIHGHPSVNLNDLTDGRMGKVGYFVISELAHTSAEQDAQTDKKP